MAVPQAEIVPAGDRVERFLAAHPDTPLTVCVGSASVTGVAWLAERTRDRPVKLLIGDLKSRNFRKSTDQNRRAALKFVRRDDVSILAWRRPKRSSKRSSDAHFKMWFAAGVGKDPHAFLVGSANLTKTGLYNNIEVMAMADPAEYDYLIGCLRWLLR